MRTQLERHHESSFGWALHCCGRRTADAEEVLQETYLKVLDGRARYDGRASFKTWLFAVIRRTAASERRRGWLRNLGLVRFVKANDTTEHAESPADALNRTQDQEMFRRLLAQLPRRQQEVLHLVFYQDMTVQQAAEVLDISLGSARQHYERGKKRMRQLMAVPEESYARQS